MTNWARLRTLTLTTGLVIVGIGVIFMLVGTFYNISNFIEAAKWVLSMGLGITSLGIAFHSIVISEESRKIAGESDEKMKIVESINVRRMIDEFLDRRLMLHERLLSIKRMANYAKEKKIERENELLLYNGKSDFEIYYIFSVWVCLRYLREINKLRERLNSDNQKVIIKDTSILFNDLDWGLDFIVKNFDEKYDMGPEYKSQIKQIYDIVSDFNEFEDSEFRAEIVKLKDKLTK